MTSTELATIEQPFTQAPLAVVMDYARAVSTASMLPANYRGKPADIMLAVGLGQSMGLSPAESLYRIDVIQGKPCASAELIAANVRKAGHRLRLQTDEQAQSVTATIIRADDPEFPFSVTRDMAWAQQMGLHNKDNYRKQPLTMLQWRAISAVARLACPEALYGVSYTPDEMGDMPEQRSGGLGAVLAEQVEPNPLEVADAERRMAEASPLLNTSSALAKRMFATFNEAGITERDDRLRYVSDVVGRTVESSGQMTDADAEAVIDALQADLDTPFPDATADGEASK